MLPAYSPSAGVVREHLNHLQLTAHLPRWQRAAASLELLLGLRDPAIDTALLEIVPVLDNEKDDEWALGGQTLQETLADRSARRFVRLVSRTASALSLAWLTPTADEADVLISELPAALQRQPGSIGVPSVVFASLCDLGARLDRVKALTLLDKLPPGGWLERMSLAVARESPLQIPRLIEQPRPTWIPTLPPALIRDPLTGLLSRSVLFEDPHRVGLPDWSRIATLPEPGVVMIDVDRMKTILDIHGMRSGDHVLIAIGEQLRSLFGDRVLRFGGDEFLVVWERDNLAEVAQLAVESIRTLAIPSFESPTVRIPVTVSAGVASGTEVQAVLHAADDALGRAKANGRDRVG
ncbi:MAG TPA: GGDEF domain-containing protein [Polyangiaceae bacterium]|nr:GGDEF domain-containing protein [Polyangiaceae bacterium]